MKRMQLVLLVLFLATAAHGGMVVYKVGFDFPGAYTTGGNARPTEFGASFGGEYLESLSDTLIVGAGVEYLANRYGKDSSFAFGFAPVYATAMVFPFRDGRNVMAYLRLNLGYNMAYTRNDEYAVSVLGSQKLRGDLYWGGGIGARIYNNFYLDIVYASYAGRFDPQLTPGDSITYTKLGLSISYAK